MAGIAASGGAVTPDGTGIVALAMTMDIVTTPDMGTDMDTVTPARMGLAWRHSVSTIALISISKSDLTWAAQNGRPFLSAEATSVR